MCQDRDMAKYIPAGHAQLPVVRLVSVSVVTNMVQVLARQMPGNEQFYFRRGICI